MLAHPSPKNHTWMNWGAVNDSNMFSRWVGGVVGGETRINKHA